MAQATSSYHHGDLPGALVRSAIELLEEDGGNDLSLRAVARRAGVSTAAPYRHFADRNALVSAVAGVGYVQLITELSAIHAEPTTDDELADIAVGYVRFALDHPGLFRVMFAEGCDTENAERTAAVHAITEYLNATVTRARTVDDPEALATAVWALVHGLAFLHLDGKFDASSPDEVAHRVKSAVRAVLALSQPPA
ncbi:MAG: TetR/AcrR family transcriptional regulator [Gordonia sp. (in: high G+C Gram-positive bacteria)]